MNVLEDEDNVYVYYICFAVAWNYNMVCTKQENLVRLVTGGSNGSRILRQNSKTRMCYLCTWIIDTLVYTAALFLIC